ncbi:MAG: Stf0 family sulfotransferase [Geminicoccaceae bacterium]
MAKGIIVLSEGRSGTNWLCSLTNRTERLGFSAEWFNHTVFAAPFEQKLDSDAFLDAVLRKARTPNGVFGLKIFSEQLFRFHETHGVDPLLELSRMHDIRFLCLERRDRLRQAISLVRAMQTKQWTRHDRKKGEAAYDFERICHAWFKLSSAFEFWRTWCEIRGVGERRFVYEDLLDDPSPWLAEYLDHTGERLDIPLQTRMSVQGDEQSEAWAERFREEAKSADILNGAYQKARNRKLGKLRKLLNAPATDRHYFH